MVEKGKAFVIFGKSVDRISVKDRWSIDQKGRRTVSFGIKCLPRLNTAFPTYIEVVARCGPKIFALCLPIAGCTQDGVNSDRLQGLWKSTRHIAEAAGF